MTYGANMPCQVCDKWRCECPPSWSALDAVYAHAFGERFQRQVIELAPDCNVRFSVTSPSAGLLNVLNGELTVRQFVEVMRTSSLFHANVLHEGRAVFYETHTDSLAAGLRAHRDRVHKVHARKSSNANLRSITNCGGGSAVL